MDKKFLVKMFVQNESDFNAGDVLMALSELISSRSYDVANVSVNEVTPLPIHQRSFKRMSRMDLIKYIERIGGWVNKNKMRM